MSLPLARVIGAALLEVGGGGAGAAVAAAVTAPGIGGVGREGGTFVATPPTATERRRGSGRAGVVFMSRLLCSHGDTWCRGQSTPRGAVILLTPDVRALVSRIGAADHLHAPSRTGTDGTGGRVHSLTLACRPDR